MEISWNKANLLTTIDKDIVVLSNIWEGNNKQNFCGTVIKTDNERSYKLGDYSNSWHKRDFFLAEEPVIVEPTNN